MLEYRLPEGTSLSDLVSKSRTLGDALSAIQNWDTSYIRTRLEKEDILAASEIDEAIIEWKKFLMCVAVTRAGRIGSMGMMSKKVDEVWHAAILFTSEYFVLSAQILGEGQYLHHAPNVTPPSSEPQPRNNTFQTVYHQMFGRIPTIWGVKYAERELVWEDAMQGLCVTEQVVLTRIVCDPKSDYCDEGGGQLCTDLPHRAIIRSIDSGCTSTQASCRCMPPGECTEALFCSTSSSGTSNEDGPVCDEGDPSCSDNDGPVL